MGERQKHGFNFEKLVFEMYGVVPSKGYTNSWDGSYKGVPVSIKTAKLGTDIEMADIFRQSRVNQDFYLFVGFWQGEKDNIIETHILYINGKEWEQLFDEDVLFYCQFLLNKITNDRADDGNWKTITDKARRAWIKNTPNLIRPRFKRDHKKQKRIQCAINNKDFYSHFVENYESKEPF